MAQQAPLNSPDTPMPTDPSVYVDDVLDNDPAPQSSAGDGNQQPADGGESQIDPQIEAGAREMGWSPRESWRGDPDRWVDASTFYERGQRVIPIIKERERRQAATITAQAEELSSLRARLDKMEQRDNAAAQRYTQTQLNAEYAEAIESGDHQRAAEINGKIIQARVDAQVAARPAAPQADPRAIAIWNEYQAANPWVKDPDMERSFVVEARALFNAQVGLKDRDLLDAAGERVRRLYPERFRRVERPSMADMGGEPGNASVPAGKAVYANLRPEYKAIADQMVSNNELTREQYVAECGPEAFRR